MTNPRFVLQTEGQAADFATEVARALRTRPRALPCRYFYDREGSALFESICDQPEYYLTRCERDILQAQAMDIMQHAGMPRTLVELGCGSAVKTRILLDVLSIDPSPMRYVAVDISCAALEQASLDLLEDYPTLSVHALAAEYDDGLAALPQATSPPRLFLWMGSNLGNLHRPDAVNFLRRIREQMAPDDSLLIGVDMRKSAELLQAAYNDAAGVTARFNLNLLSRINRELGGTFNLDAFEHRAEWHETVGRIEMNLLSRRRQTVSIARLGLTIDFDDSELIHTENCYKYNQEELRLLISAAGLKLQRQWTDAQCWFTVNLLRAPH
ncbi:MAG: L-histidine N(alpha)-methyltransferase [Candidatus Xenobia bacterium]